MLQRRRDPVDPDLGGHEFQVGVPVEDAAEHELPHRPARVDAVVEEVVEEQHRFHGNRVGVGEHLVPLGAARRLRNRVVHPLQDREDLALRGTEAGVHDDGDIALFARRPERFPVRVVQRRQRVVGHVVGAERPDEVVVGDPVDFGDRGVDVGTRARSHRSSESGRWRSRRCRTSTGSTPWRRRPRRPVRIRGR